MPNYTSNVSFFDPDQQALIQMERRRQLANALQTQGGQPLDPNRMAGGWVVPISPTEGIAKIAQAASGAYQQKQLDQREQDIIKSRQTRLADTLRRGMEAATGAPERPAALDPQEVQQAADQGTPTPPNIPAQAPDIGRAAQIFAQMPETQGAGMQMMMQEMQRRRLIEALQGGGQQGTASPQGVAPTTRLGGPAGGIPLSAWLATDPTGKSYVGQIAKEGMPINVRPGGTVYVPGQGPQFSAPMNGAQTMWGQNGPYQSVLPGAPQAAGTIAAATAGGQAAGKAPYTVGVVNTEGAPSLMTQQQQIEAATGKPMPSPGQMPAPAQIPQQGVVTDQILDGLRRTESGGNSFAVNPQSGAVGPYQFTPKTLQWLSSQGVKFNPFDEQQARQVAGQYLSYLTKQNGGDINKALAAYGGFKTKNPDQYIASVTGQPSKTPGLRLQDQAQSAEQQSAGKQLGDYATTVMNDAAKAAVSNRYLDNMELASKDIQLGKLAPAQSALTQWAQASGIPVPEEAKKAAGSAQALASMAIKMAGQATRQSDAQPSQLQYMKMLESMPDIGRTPDGFKKIVAYLRDANNYNIAKMQHLEQWKQTHNGTASGFEAAWPAVADKLPFVWNTINAQNAAAPNAQGEASIDDLVKKYGNAR